MEISELIKRVRRIEIKARGLTNEMFSGEYHSAFKGRGMSFSEVREYQFGDDVRNIDWNVTARFDHPYVKVYEEERELTVMLLLDMSASENIGTKGSSKRELLTEIAAVIAFSVIQNNDKIGVVLFTSEVELFIPPRKGKSHVLRIIRDILNFEAKQTGTNIGDAVRYMTRVVKKKSTVFLISDFLDQGYQDALKITCRKHDLICFRLKDHIEAQLPSVGLLKVRNAETGTVQWIDTSSKNVRNHYNSVSRKREDELQHFFSKNGIDHVSIETGKNYIQPIRNLFKKREGKR